MSTNELNKMRTVRHLPKIIAFAGRHLVVVFILLKQIFFFLQTVKLSAHNGVEHLSTWQSSIQQSLLTTQTMLDGRLQRASTLYQNSET